MESKTIKISETNYKWLLALASELQRRSGKPVSFDGAINVIKNKKMQNKKLISLAGSWNMSDDKWENIQKELNKGWKKWKIPSV